MVARGVIKHARWPQPSLVAVSSESDSVHATGYKSQHVHKPSSVDDLGHQNKSLKARLQASLSRTDIMVRNLKKWEAKKLHFHGAVCPPVDVEVVPHNEGLNRPQVEPLEGVIHHEAVLARVLVDLVEVLLQ